jgi:hypothetical protein
LIDVTEKFREIMSQKVRPKCEPKIIVEGINALGNNTRIEFGANDIKDFTYKREVDPVGRNLPYIELSWTEAFSGLLGEDNEAIKYNSLKPLMKVTLELEQYYSFFNSWHDFLNKKWADVFLTSWRSLFKKPQSEKITFPTLFLVGKPTVEGNTVNWVAKDLLFFLDSPQQIGFVEKINYRNPMRKFLLDERATYKDNTDVVEYLEKSQNNIINEGDVALDKPIIFDGLTKNLLKDFAAAKNYFWDFKSDSMYLRGFLTAISNYSPVFKFNFDLLASPPTLEKNKNISSYCFSQYNAKGNASKKYELTKADQTTIVGNTNVYKFIFDGWGRLVDVPEEQAGFVPNIISKEIYTTLDNVVVEPVTINRVENIINNDKSGDVFNENNSCNFYSKNAQRLKNRLIALDKYFNEKIYTATCEGLPAFHVEPCDVVEVETNLYKNGERIIKKGIVVSQELTYNGAFKQKNIIHEVK